MASAVSSVAYAEEGNVDFMRDIRPLLSDRCFHCHGPDTKHREANLRLDQPDGDDGALRTYEGTTAIKPKDLEASVRSDERKHEVGLGFDKLFGAGPAWFTSRRPDRPRPSR